MIDHGITKVRLSPSKIDASGYNEEVSRLWRVIKISIRLEGTLDREQSCRSFCKLVQ